MSRVRLPMPGGLARDLRNRSFAFWVGLRLFFLPVGLLVAPATGFFAWAAIVAVVSLLVILDVRVCRERVLFANLGVSWPRVAVTVVPAVGMLEGSWQLVALLVSAR